MMRLHLLLFSLLLLSLPVLSQNKQKSDSLMKVLPTTEDTQRVNVLREISYYNRVDNPTAALKYADEAIALANKLDWEAGKFSANMQKGLVYYNVSKHDSSIKYFERAQVIAEKRQKPSELAAIYSNIGNAYGDIGQNKKCLDFYLKSDYWTRLSGQPFKTVYMKVNIGTIYSVMEQHDSALVFYEEALKTMLELDSTDEKLYIVYGNLGATYMELKDTVKAEEAFRRSHYFAVKYDNTRGLASSYDHLGIIEFWKGHTDTALAYFRKAIALSYIIEAGQSISEGCYHIGNTFNELGMYDSALYYLSRGVRVAEDIKDIYTMDNYYEEISRAYEHTGRLDSALHYYKKMQATRDTMFNMNRSNIVNEMRQEIENEKSLREIDLLKEQDEKKSLILYAAIALGVLVLLLGIVAFNRYLVKKRSAALLQQQKEEIQEQKEIIEEKNKDITDSIVYAKRIQNAILPSDERMKELFPESWCCFIPKDIVSGDFFWFEQEGDYRLFGVIDCTGHGVPGALLSVVGHSILGKALSDHKLVMPDKILAFLDEEIHRTLRHREQEQNAVQDGMDVALCCYHEKSQTIYYSGAFNPMYVLRNGSITEYKADKLMIGAGTSRYRPYQLHSVKVEKGDEVILFSDGFADQFGGPFGKKLKYKPFQQMLLSVAGKPMQEQAESVQRSFEEWKKNFDQVDDVCVVAVRL